VTFPIFEKIDVNGPERSPLYAALTKTEPAGDISWNFEKFVVSKDGTVVGRFKSKVAPDSPELVAVIERELRK
jgi:glutathione peroxidase